MTKGTQNLTEDRESNNPLPQFLRGTISNVTPGADFTNRLKSGFGLKFKTLVLNSVKNVLSQCA